MPGPAPKKPALRQRRNSSVTKAILPAESAPRLRAPSLCKRDVNNDSVDWHPMTKRWWKDLWASPMADEFLRADEHGLFRLAVLIDLFWTDPSKELASEIRLQQQAFGLTPLDRRRLEWSIEQAEEAKDKGERRRFRAAVVIPGNDPRGILE